MNAEMRAAGLQYWASLIYGVASLDFFGGRQLLLGTDVWGVSGAAALPAGNCAHGWTDPNSAGARRRPAPRAILATRSEHASCGHVNCAAPGLLESGPQNPALLVQGLHRCPDGTVLPNVS